MKIHTEIKYIYIYYIIYTCICVCALVYNSMYILHIIYIYFLLYAIGIQWYWYIGTGPTDIQKHMLMISRDWDYF